MVDIEFASKAEVRMPHYMLQVLHGIGAMQLIACCSDMRVSA